MTAILLTPDEQIRLANKSTADILVFSDSHGQSRFIRDILSRYQKSDLAIHLGDHTLSLTSLAEQSPIRLTGVAGNCDGISGRHLPDQQLLVIAGYRIFMSHGHLQHVKRNLNGLLAVGAGDFNEASIILYGHTHIAMDTCRLFNGHPIRMINPGSSREDPGMPASAALLRLAPDGVSCEFLLDQP